MPRYLVLLRAIANVPMAPFRRALEELGFDDVLSHGGTGNLVFTTERRDARAMEDTIGKRLRTVAFLRTRAELAKAVARDASLARADSAVLFLKGLPGRVRRGAFGALDFAGTPPVLSGREVYFVFPTSLKGRRTHVDFEKLLGVPGTFRASNVVARLLERIDDL